MANLEIKNLHKRFNDTEILKDISFKIDDGEFVCFLGPSGCGKSTLLRTISGLEEITSGDIIMDGKSIIDILPAKRNIAMVFQSYALYPHMTVFDNIAFPLKLRGFKKSEIQEKVEEIAKMLQLAPYLQRKPKALSGGQRQRVAIGRCIVCMPEILLLDEPLSNLDASLRTEMRTQLAKMHKDLKKTMIFVTHDQVEAMTLANKIIVLKEGVVQQCGTPLELYHCPANLFVARFIGAYKINTYKGTVVDVQDTKVTVKSKYLSKLLEMQIEESGRTDLINQEVTIGIRENRMWLDQEQDISIQAEIILVERLGGQSVLYAKVEDLDTVIATKGTYDVNIGEKITIYVKHENFMLFDKNGNYVARQIPDDLKKILHKG